MVKPSPSKRLAVFALVCLVPAPTLGVLFGMVLLPGTTLGAALFFCAKVWILVAPALWHFAVERQDSASLRPARYGLGMGLLTGLIIGGGILGAYTALGSAMLDLELFRARMQEIGLSHRGVFIGLAAYWIVVNSLLEEYVWRWFVTQQWQKLLRPKAAVILSALCFTLHHVLVTKVYLPWATVIVVSCGVFTGGLIWSWLFARYRSIWPGYISHVLADAAIFAIGFAMLAPR
ncbi:MAG: type II CAAX endopeptidase family protein [bacterium]